MPIESTVATSQSSVFPKLYYLNFLFKRICISLARTYATLRKMALNSLWNPFIEYRHRPHIPANKSY